MLRERGEQLGNEAGDVRATLVVPDVEGRVHHGAGDEGQQGWCVVLRGIGPESIGEMDREPVPPSAGALHATEVPFVFETVRAKYEQATTPEDEAMGEAMNAYWAAFARSGDPGGDGRPAWPSYSAQQDVIMDFAVGGPVAKPDPSRARLDFVERLASSSPRP